MGFLHKLWDDTLAGPAPDHKLLRKYDSPFSAAVPSPPALTITPPRDDHGLPAVTRSITILRANSVDSGSLPSSPTPAGSGSTTPTSPFSPMSTPRGDFKRFTRRRKPTAAAAPSESLQEPITPTVFDWIVIDALDR